MSEFVPRTRKPDNGNKYYISSRYAGEKGWNPCILGNPKTTYGRDQYLNVLPNCVGWEVGRFNEIVGKKNCDYLYIVNGNNHAKDLIKNAKKQGLKVGMEPKLGAAIVWTGGSDGYGHTGGVEFVSSDMKKIRISQSGWNYNGVNHMWFADHYIGDGNWLEGSDYSWMRGKYRFVGFVYLPEEEDMTKEEVYEISKKAAIDAILEYNESVKDLPPSTQEAEVALAWMKEQGIMKGNSKGNQMPQASLKREDYAIMEYRKAHGE